LARAQKISGLNIGAELGSSRFIMEVPTDFSRKIIEFDNKFGFTTDIELTKYLSNHWEIGIDLNYTKLNGNRQHPSFSAERYHIAINNLKDKPVEYNNQLFGQKVFARFFFTPLNEKLKKINSYPFISFGVGVLNYKSKFKYVDASNNNLIFGKNYNGFSKLSTAVYSFGAGIKTSWSSKLFLISSINYNFVNYDFLDVMHNNDRTGNKMDILGMYFDFKVGIFYSITPIKETKERKKIRSKKNGEKRKSKSEKYLPFAR
jgi:hypothetical protein